MGLSLLLKDSIIYGGANLLGKLIVFVAFPIYASTLTTTQYGILELVFALTGLIGCFISLGMNHAVQRFYWEFGEKDRSQLVMAGFNILIGCSFLFVLILIVTFPFWEELIKNLKDDITVIGVVSAAALIISLQWLEYWQDIFRIRMQRSKYLISSSGSKIMMSLAGIITVLYFNGNVDQLLFVQSLTVIIFTSFILFFNDGLYRVERFRVLSKKLISFGYPFVFSGLAYWIFSAMDKWMLAAMVSPDEAGIYSAAFRLSSVVFLVSTAFGLAWSPYALKVRSENPKGYRTVYAQVLIILVAVMTVVSGIIAVFSGELISIILPNAYLDSADIMIALCFGFVFNATQQVTAIGISLEKKTYIFALVTWLTAGLNIVLNLISIPILGALGAAVASAISYIFLTVTYLAFSQFFHRLPINFAKLGILIAVCLSFVTAAYLSINTVLDWDLVVLKSGLVFLVIIFCIFVVAYQEKFNCLIRK